MLIAMLLINIILTWSFFSSAKNQESVYFKYHNGIARNTIWASWILVLLAIFIFYENEKTMFYLFIANLVYGRILYWLAIIEYKIDKLSIEKK